MAVKKEGRNSQLICGTAEVSFVCASFEVFVRRLRKVAGGGPSAEGLGPVLLWSGVGHHHKQDQGFTQRAVLLASPLSYQCSMRAESEVGCS